MQIIIGVVSSAIGEMATLIKNELDGSAKKEDSTTKSGDSTTKSGDSTSGDSQISDGFTNLSEKLIKTLGKGIIAKYKVRIASVISAWTGSSSAPWHVTIGNPKKPFFSSGDMVCESVTLKFGAVLSFNDLPSTIDVKIKLKPARNLGLQEIFERFNTGAGRSYIALSDSFESDAPNRYWSNWWKKTPSEPSHTTNDGLGADSTTEEMIKEANEKNDAEYDDKNKKEKGK